ncbi:hypothetical protein B0H14DRAFT_555347 [Mycena olivaceomarginata]|nr:hypothetical protein B0H14DRAFT_555347 [Mycena olivaceomarginata]
MCCSPDPRPGLLLLCLSLLILLKPGCSRICRRNTFRVSFPSDHIFHRVTEPPCQFWRYCAYYRMETRPRMLSAPFNLS